jgi:hypothetical protein
MRARESFGVNHCTEFARNDQRTFAFFWIWSDLQCFQKPERNN